MYDGQIANQETPNSTNLEVHNRAAQNMVHQRNYENHRKKLVEMRNDSTEVSTAVLDFLSPTKTESKFDVENGTAKINYSLKKEGK
jgi:hypothetical protein